MDIIEPILTVASQIYTLVEKVKANKKRCRRVSNRIQSLASVVESIRNSGTTETSDNVKKTLRELSITLQSAQKLIEKYTVAKWIERILKSGSHGDEFDEVNDRLDDAFQGLSLSLQVEQRDKIYKEFKLSSSQKDEDKKEDRKELQKLLWEYKEGIIKDVEKMMEMLKKPSIYPQDIRLINERDLKYEASKKPFMTTPTSQVYKGEFCGFPVAIKRYTEPVKSSPSEVKSFFEREVVTMKRFESPNILRMFGICVKDENGRSPQFFIVMEYCERGSLRQVLDSCTRGLFLSWTMRARMCLDAAQGLYRLHQTEDKSNVHGSISSYKFLVTEGFQVKLGGFELAKTETSLRKAPKRKETSSLCYTSPQRLQDVNYIYSKECEMYSFGIVLWEIATSKKPFENWSDKDFYRKVYEEKFQESLPEDCPEPLAELIDACRAFDSFQRPSAGVLMDSLRSVVAQLEEQ